MAKPDALRRLGGGRWETKDGRFQIEPQSGTWVVVDTTQQNEFGLPLVRGPYPSLGAARDAIDDARVEGPAVSPLAERIEQVRLEPPSKPSATRKRPSAKVRPDAKAEPPTEPKPPTLPPEPPREPDWLRDLPARDRRRARDLMARLAALDIDDPEAIARAEIVDDQPALARLALERRLERSAQGSAAARAAVRAAIDAVLDGTDEELGASWRLVDGRDRPIRTLDPEA